MVIVRAATPGDAGAVAAIYNREVTGSTATFDTELRSVADQRGLIRRRDAGRHPFLVAEIDGSVVGFGSLSAYKPRAGYRYTVEDSVYVDPGAQGSGVGRALLTELVRLADHAEHHCVLAFIATPNAASERLHELLGFEPVGVQREVGWKHGRWVDVAVHARLHRPGLPPVGYQGRGESGGGGGS
ncbi:MAG TPA: GNAT family N-acetyltransferase [Mycobacteriales bacterium]|nr:GNAT family N-acetyltransferase [Mycobacteriales bacterium]